MAHLQSPSVLIVGAGSVGLVTGYYLSLAGAQVTYLVRPKRAEVLKRTQFLYSFDKNHLHEFKSYSYLTSPSTILSSTYDYILVTLDGKSVQSEEGETLVKIIGQAARDKTTKVIIGSVFLGARDWFLEKSGLPGDQVTSGGLGFPAYSGKTTNLPVHPPADVDLVKKSDVAYMDNIGNGFILDDYVPSISSSFSELYNACGVSNCVVWSPAQSALTIFPLFAVFIGLELLGWPKTEDIDTESEVWKLTTAAAKEIQTLDICGEAGTQAALATTESTFVQMSAYLDEKLRPLDYHAFNRYHHGGKVIEQDRMHIERCISQGVTEGKPMSALKTLLQRINH
ncbi:hypothetical protein NOF04DRAFT_11513 [Fusarium oxysporum II5]|uniref:Ketopantoate reductase N-terminal domain-containing protein n=2 Tax=Fusarium oxysporum species complex TaxID=171631 RepID=X0J028_FUSO5|nr:uncharacterized protein FOIG_12743 [Fusarium odoratissimum NRRL 54006]EXL94548.1 hypothetical protein FOIG_12743 [Fusarium odoratissimum NRRL 54006]KAK2122499.1 hypothetical protein NOF04DRAFT_11513 [Fusarium oxysporum II5]TXB96479.1 hypothetical protein FocTR4_00011051 [Fusarium oxysporum f. sp. cubense]